MQTIYVLLAFYSVPYINMQDPQKKDQRKCLAFSLVPPAFLLGRDHLGSTVHYFGLLLPEEEVLGRQQQWKVGTPLHLIVGGHNIAISLLRPGMN